MFIKIILILSLILISYPVMAEDKAPLNAKAVIRTKDDKTVWEDYVKSLENKVNEAWKPEYGDKKSTSVLFKVKADGTVCPAVKTIKSSGSKEYDAAAIDAIKKAPSFGAFPKETTAKGKIFIINLNNDNKPEPKKEVENNEQNVEKTDEADKEINKQEREPEAKEEKKEPPKEETSKEEQKKEEKPFIPKFSN